MNDSILDTIKTMLDISENDTAFDTEVIVLINSAFSTLYQLGVGPSKCFNISDSYDEWSDFLSDTLNLESVKKYIYMKVKVAFDGNNMSSALLDVFNKSIQEEEWRLNAAVETKWD